MLTDIRIIQLIPSFKEELFRTPLKFGTGVINGITSLTVEAVVENKKGDIATGYGNILLSDTWAFPSELPHEIRDKSMRLIAVEFCRYLEGINEFAHPIDLIIRSEGKLKEISSYVQSRIGIDQSIPELASIVSISPIDAAIHDAFGKVNNICSYDGYGPEFMRDDLSAYLGKEFRGRYIKDYINKSYTNELPVFHLVGGLDELSGNPVTEDGLPNTLEQWIRRDGVYCFKIKLTGKDIYNDVSRTVDVFNVASSILQGMGRKHLFLSTDSNEMNENPESVVEYLLKLKEKSPAAYGALLYIEQPTERDISNKRFNMRSIARLKPVLADEGITSLQKFDEAMDLGWSGIALKICKGHSAALLYFCKAKHHNMIYTVQDLTNPGLSFIQSAGFAARINPLMGVEYNSRQYLPFASRDVQDSFKDVFTVKDGKIRMSGIKKIGLGY